MDCFSYKNGVATPNCRLCKHYEEDPSVGYVGCSENVEVEDCIRYGAYDFYTDKELLEAELSEYTFWKPSYSDFNDPFEYADFCRYCMKKAKILTDILSNK